VVIQAQGTLTAKDKLAPTSLLNARRSEKATMRKDMGTNHYELLVSMGERARTYS
jgi:hypothetical protein